MTQSIKQLVVIGAGVIGLTTGIRLLERGYAVKIIARDLPPNTTSDVAAAYWFPTGEPKQRVNAWGRVAYSVLSELANVPESGVVFRYFNKLSHRPLPDPDYLDIVDDFERIDCTKMPGNYADGFRMRIPLIDTPIYMAYLVKRYHDLGGEINQHEVSSLLELAKSNRLIVNCSGAWAAGLADDSKCFAIRGQIVRIRKPEGLSPELFSGPWEGEPTYIIPRRNDCLLGGSKQVDDWNREPDMAIAEGILARCAAFNPILRDPAILEHKVGLRPGRSEVRLDVEQLTSHCTVIHNYGHGEDGHGMAWGCAAEVVELASHQFMLNVPKISNKSETSFV